VLSLYGRTWPTLGRWLQRGGEQAAHERMIELLRRSDGSTMLVALARAIGRATLPDRPTRVGGVTLPTPLVLAAGFVKGDGFASEADALVAAAQGRDLLPGWRIMPSLVGAVELGSYTRHPRLGNRGPVVWRDDATRSTQNRVGLRNPGAAAAAAFLAARRSKLPAVWGVSLAASPGMDDPDDSAIQLREAATCFGRAFASPGSGPTWYTLNLSCPNTEDDPGGLQTASLARRLASTVADVVSAPLWVKVGPDLSTTQYDVLVDALSEAGARAVVATNTLARPAPTGSMTAGLGGAALRPYALAAVARLAESIDRRGATLDVVGSGGILEGAHLRAFVDAGAKAAMVYSALVFRGPLAAALILREAARSS
jgi:dihydroorotate dehydrogenase